MAEKAKEDRNTSIIRKYLEQRAFEDPVLAEKLRDPNKSMAKCMDYIQREAKKKAVNGCAMIEDSVVFGWAVHYWDEAATAPASKASVSIEAAPGELETSPAQDTATKRTPSHKPRNKAKDTSFMQLSLFDL